MNVNDRLTYVEASLANALGAGMTKYDDEIDLIELWGVIWRGKWLIVAFTLVFSVCAVIFARSLPNIYTSHTLLAQSEGAQGGGMARMAGQLGGLASLAGINLGGKGGEDKVAVAIEVLKSRKFIGNFIESHNILPELMAAERWDVATRTLVLDGELFDAVNQKWVRDVKPPKQPKPSAWEAYKAFSKNLSVAQDKQSGFVTVSVEHKSPELAQAWAAMLVQDLNLVMRDKDVNEATRSINFLKEQLSVVALADMRSVFYQLIEEQMKTIMLAEVRDEYVFSTIDPPVIAEEKSSPKRALICVLAAIIGGVCALIVLFVRHFLRGD
jgi:uncharacterized protein involved in exopolysaccharide biosynthesis